MGIAAVTVYPAPLPPRRRRDGRGMRVRAAIPLFVGFKVQTGESPEDLLQRIGQAQDKAAFESLFRQFAPRIKAYLLKGGAPSQQAEDIAQEAMLTVWRRAPLFDPARGTAAAWIYTIARNHRIDQIRRDRRRALAAEQEAMPEEPLFGALEAEILRDGQAVKAALQDLPPEQADVVAQFFFGGKPHSEIALALNVPLGTVKSRLRLAMGRLRVRLGGAA